MDHKVSSWAHDQVNFVGPTWICANLQGQLGVKLALKLRGQVKWRTS